MNKEIAKKWIEELRSGKHVQGIYALEDHDGSKCCLGVLCADVLNLPKEIDLDGIISYEGSAASLTQRPLELSGIKNSEGKILKFTEEEKKILSKYFDKNSMLMRDGWTYLSSLNDKRVPFNVIADIIENHVEEL